jgi:hypothetical protein
VYEKVHLRKKGRSRKYLKRKNAREKRRKIAGGQGE